MQDGTSSRTAVVAVGRSCLRDPVTSTTVDRLRDGRTIAAVLRSRRQRAGRHLALHAADRRDTGPPRVGIVASRRVGGAVQRNRAKRLIREGVRTVHWVPGVDLVIVARRACAAASLSDVRDELVELARRLDLTLETV